MIKIDASSFIYSIKIDWIHVLKEMYKDLIITDSVYREVIINGKENGKADAYIGEKLIKKYGIQIHELKKNKENELGLGAGETETILNALELNCACLIDDKKAIRIADSFDLHVLTVSLSFLNAYKQQIINDKEFENYFEKWITVASPSYEDIFLIKKAKELMCE
jgi:predicted nucleic acid-binding protein